MKILQIGVYPLDKNCIKGGIEASVYGLSHELIKSNSVVVFDLPRTQISEDTQEELENGMRIYRYAANGHNISAIKRCRTVLDDIKKEHPDVCHIHGTGLFSYLLWKELKKLGIKTVVTVHGLLHIEKGNILNKKFSIKGFIQYVYQSVTEFIFLSKCDEVIVDTPYVATAIETYYKQHKIWHLPTFLIIPQGINSAFYSINRCPKLNLLLSVGAIGKRKGHLFLLQAYHKILQQLPDVHLIIAGTLADSSYLADLKRYITNNHLSDRVDIYDDALLKDIFAWYSMADIFVLHSEEESQGIVFAEAMAVGLPIVATNVGGVPDVVKQGRNGLLSNYSDVDAFANDIVLLLQNETLKAQMSLHNKADASNYNWSVITNRILKIYKAS